MPRGARGTPTPRLPALWDMGGPVLMALGSGKQLPPGYAGGKTVVLDLWGRPAQTVGYILEEVKSVLQRRGEKCVASPRLVCLLCGLRFKVA